METIEKTIEVEVPLSKAYSQWTQFEEFPQFTRTTETGGWRGEIRSGKKVKHGGQSGTNSESGH